MKRVRGGDFVQEDECLSTRAYILMKKITRDTNNQPSALVHIAVFMTFTPACSVFVLQIIGRHSAPPLFILILHEMRQTRGEGITIQSVQVRHANPPQVF